MSATNATNNYSLPIFIGSDIPSWLIDWNNTMTAIDTALTNTKAVADQAVADIQLAEVELGNLNNVTANNGAAIAVNAGEIASVKNSLQGVITSVTGLQQEMTTIGNNIGEIRSVAGWVYSGALSVGETTLTIDCTNGLSDDALVDIYIDVVGVTPEAVEVTGNLMKFTFAEQTQDVRVRVKVSGV